ncbi:LysR family transcriptional regulator [Bordetella petrii]|nr:LysR family transcriptional regulator [Bordetella petrii]
MKIAAFSTLRAVLEHGTFAMAAGVLNITPSAVSMQMKHLEQFFGQPLFDRSGAHPRPTPFAYHVAELVGPTLDGIESLRRGSLLVVEGSLRVGVIEALQAVVLPGAVRWLKQHHPRLELQLVRGNSGMLTAAVKAGDIDAALVSQPSRASAQTLSWSPVWRQPLDLIAPRDAPDAPLADLFARYDWIRYDRGTTSGAMAARYVHKTVGNVRSTMELGSPSAIVAMVSAGLGLSLLAIPDPLILSCYPVKRVTVRPPPPTLQMSLAMRKLDADSRGLQALLQAIKAGMAHGLQGGR